MCDLDEWFVTKDGTRLTDYLDTIKHSIVMIPNYWAYIDGDLIHYTKIHYELPYRTKTIYRYDFKGVFGNHYPYGTEQEIFTCFDIRMLHIEDDICPVTSAPGARKKEVLDSKETGKYLNLEGELYPYED
jgi:hypothetical protein